MYLHSRSRLSFWCPSQLTPACRENPLALATRSSPRLGRSSGRRDSIQNDAQDNSLSFLRSFALPWHKNNLLPKNACPNIAFLTQETLQIAFLRCALWPSALFRLEPCSAVPIQLYAHDLYLLHLIVSWSQMLNMSALLTLVHANLYHLAIPGTGILLPKQSDIQYCRLYECRNDNPFIHYSIWDKSVRLKGKGFNLANGKWINITHAIAQPQWHFL